MILALLVFSAPLTGCLDEQTRVRASSDGGNRASCHPSYEGACLDPDAIDYDCEGGTGNGPRYVGAVTVTGPDDYGLDRDGDGSACAW